MLIILHYEDYKDLPLYKYAMRLMMTPAHFSNLVHELERLGLVEIRKVDERRKELVLTERGKQINAALQQIGSQII